MSLTVTRRGALDLAVEGFEVLLGANGELFLFGEERGFELGVGFDGGPLLDVGVVVERGGRQLAGFDERGELLDGERPAGLGVRLVADVEFLRRHVGERRVFLGGGRFKIQGPGSIEGSNSKHQRSASGDWRWRFSGAWILGFGASHAHYIRVSVRRPRRFRPVSRRRSVRAQRRRRRARIAGSSTRTLSALLKEL